MTFNKGNIPWNKGTTKETNPIMNNISNILKGRIRPEEEKIKQSITRKQRLASGEISVWNKGKRLSEEHKKKLSEAHTGLPCPNKGKSMHLNTGRTCFKKGIIPKYKGKKMPESARENMSKAHKGIPLSEECKKHIGDALRGKKRSPEICKKISDGLKGHKKSPETLEKMRINRLKQIIPSKDTLIEIALYNELDKRGINYKKHISIENMCQPDIIFPNKKIAVFVDGEYWHSETFRNGKVWKTDRRIDKTLRENGWKVLRFWGKEIKRNTNYCINKIIKEIE